MSLKLDKCLMKVDQEDVRSRMKTVIRALL